MTSARLTVRRIVIAGVLAAISILLSITPIGYVPVPTAAGHATTMHIPAIIGGIMEGWLVGGIIGIIFGLTSFFRATIPMFKDPLVAILPRIFIGITAYFSYRVLRRASIPCALVIAGFLLGLAAAFSYQVGQLSVAGGLLVAGLALGLVAAFVYLVFQQEAEAIALTVAAAVGTLTNTILVLSLAVWRGYMAPGVALGVALTHGIPEIIVAAIIVAAVGGSRPAGRPNSEGGKQCF